jgi:uncharacterized protein (TIRG00374 family)
VIFLKRYWPVLLGAGLFTLILRKVDLHSTWSHIQQADWKLLVLALITFVAMSYLRGMRWSYLLKMQGAHYSVWNCFLIYMSSLALGNVTPGRAGDFVKVLYLNKDLKFSTGTSMASVLVDRVFDLYLLLILGCLGILAYPMPPDPRLIRAVWIFCGILLVITLLAFNQKIGGALLKAVFHRMMKAEHRKKTNKAFRDFHEGMESFYRPALIYPLFLSLLAYLISFWGCWLIAQSMGIQVNILYLSFCISVVNIVSLLSLFGMGTREGALIILFGLISLTQDQALAYSLMLFFLGTLVFTSMGFLCFLAKPIELPGLFKPSLKKR